MNKGNFTIITARVGRSTAEIAMECGYCHKKNYSLTILPEQDYFFIDGYRTYERVNDVPKVERKGVRLIKEVVPYVPASILQQLSRPPLNAANFRQKFTQRRMCLTCHEKLHRFFAEDLSFPRIVGECLKVATKHIIRICVSAEDKHYFCRCCNCYITGNTGYCRVNHKTVVCLDCVELLKPFIGAEFTL